MTVREGARVTAIDERGVTIEADGESERIDARTVIWAAGVHAVALADALARATGADTDRGGRIKVEPDLTIPGHPEISVIGDVACLDGPGGKPLPGLATVAIQQAHHVAKGIHARRGRGIDSRSATSTRARWRSSAEAGRSARSGASSSRAGPRSSPTSACTSSTSAAQLGRRLEVMLKWVGSPLR